MEGVNPLKMLRSWTLANIKIAMLWKINLIRSQRMYNISSLKNLEGCFMGHLRTFRLEEDAYQVSGQWQAKAADNHRLGSGVKLRAADG